MKRWGHDKKTPRRRLQKSFSTCFWYFCYCCCFCCLQYLLWFLFHKLFSSLQQHTFFFIYIFGKVTPTQNSISFFPMRYFLCYIFFFPFILFLLFSNWELNYYDDVNLFNVEFVIFVFMAYLFIHRHHRIIFNLIRY